MLLLAIDTSTDVGSVALLQDDLLLGQHLLRAPMNLLSWLSPAIRQLLKETNLQLENLDAVATGIGPGSFTGVRLQLATARTLAQVRGIPLYGVSMLEALAYQALPHHGMILACSDARRGELFAGIFEARGNFLIRKEDFLCVGPDALVAHVSRYKEPWLLVGEMNPCKSVLLEKIERSREAPPEAGIVQAWTVGRLAYQKRGEQSGDPYGVKPLYLRASNAEIEKKKIRA